MEGSNMLAVVGKIRKSIASDLVLGVKKYSTPLENWYHIQLDKYNEEGKMLIVLVSESETILGWLDKRDDEENIAEYHYHWIENLDDDEVAKIIKEVKNGIEKISIK